MNQTTQRPNKQDNEKMKKHTLLAVALSFLCVACAGALPGGSDSINQNFYQNGDQLKEFADTLQPGMPRDEVFARLGRVEKDFKRLHRNEIISVLFGGRENGVPVSFNPDGDIKSFLESLDGYNLSFKQVKRRHGFTSPIRIQTDEEGFGYQLDLIFRNGLLLEKPFVTGGRITGADTNTIFDYLNPGTLLNSAID
jgi:hypothetical protein